MKKFLAFLLVGSYIAGVSAQVAFESFATGLSLPLAIENAGDGSKRLFIVEKSGTIIVLDSTGSSLGTFLNISGKLGNSGGEQGLLGLAFHPNFASNGYFFVNYTTTIGTRRTIIERYQVSPPDANQANSNSGTQILSFTQPHGNHNGGDLAFSPVDGFLYIPTGDGGSGNDPMERAQNLTSPHGKILRISVDNFNDSPPYNIPADNPFGTTKYTSEFQDTVDEIWAWGLRNPWRFSFTEVGDMWIGDVGQEDWEEVNYVPIAENQAGINFGWDCREGMHDCGGCGPPPDCASKTFWDPIHEYDLSRQSITGGEVFSGPHYPSIQGRYVFADYVHDRMWLLDQSSGRSASISEISNAPFSVAAFGKDENGHVYAATHGSGVINRIVDQGALPIELMEVRIERYEKTNLLSWETSLEINASHFEIERSQDKKAFEQIGIVPTKGEHVDGPTSYQFPDEVTQDGEYFYRLKAVDQDGSYSYSMILQISVGSQEDLVLSPNPATDQVSIFLPEIADKGELQIFDLSGKILHTQPLRPNLQDTILTLDTSTYPRGVVIVRLTFSDQEFSKKLMLYH